MKAMNIFANHFYLLLLLVFFQNAVLAQIEKRNIKIATNSIFMDGSSSFQYVKVGVNYERKIYGKATDDKILISTGFWKWYSLIFKDYIVDSRTKGYAFPIVLNYLGGVNSHHYEISFGARFNIFVLNSKSPIALAPIINIGYRYQKPEGGILFKTYLGLGGIGLALGYSF